METPFAPFTSDNPAQITREMGDRGWKCREDKIDGTDVVCSFNGLKSFDSIGPLLTRLWDRSLRDSGLVRHRWVARRGAGAPRVAAPRASPHVGLDPLGPPRCTASVRPPRRGVLRGDPLSPFTGDNPARKKTERHGG